MTFYGVPKIFGSVKTNKQTFPDGNPFYYLINFTRTQT